MKLNINTDLYHNIRDVIVSTNYGVYTDRKVGHTDQYRQLMQLGERPSFSLSGEKTSGLVRLNRSTTPHIHQVGINDILVSNYELAGNKTDAPSADAESSETDVCNYIKLPDSDIRVYGRQLNILGKKLVMMPQVFVPFVKGGDISCPQAPDFVVSVNVTFKCDEGCMQFSKTFVPQIKLIRHTELMDWYTHLKSYSDKCAQGQPVGTLVNNSSIKVYDKHSDFFLGRTIKMLAGVW